MEHIDGWTAQMIEVFHGIDRMVGVKEMMEAAKSLRPVAFRRQVVTYALENSCHQFVWSWIAKELHIPERDWPAHTCCETSKQPEQSPEYISGWNEAMTAAAKVIDTEFKDLRKRFEAGGAGADAMGHKSHVCAFLMAEIHKLFKTGLPDKVGRVKVTIFNVTQP